MQVADIVCAIEKTAPLAGAASWDKSGLQVACRHTDVRRLAVALDPVPATIEKALDRGADFILTHHPLSLSPHLPNRLDNYHAVLSLLLRADAGLYAAHTSLDVQPDGPVGWLARHLCLRHPVLLEETGPGCGFGLAGDLPRPLSLAELVQSMATRVNMDLAVTAGTVPERISRVAYCTGSGASLMEEAAASGADLYITGDVKYHAALDARIAILDVGHHSLEEEMMREMAQRLGASLDVETFFVPSVSPFARACAG